MDNKFRSEKTISIPVSFMVDLQNFYEMLENLNLEYNLGEITEAIINRSSEVCSCKELITNIIYREGE